MDLLDALKKLNDNPNDDGLTLECRVILQDFNQKHENLFAFDDCNASTYNALVNQTFMLLSKKHQLSLDSLKVIRILSRGKMLVDGLRNFQIHVDSSLEVIFSAVDDDALSVELLKCLCNWVYHRTLLRVNFIENDVSVRLLDNMEKVEKFENSTFFYKLRILFLMTTFEESERGVLLNSGIIRVLTVMTEKGLQNSGSLDKKLEETLAEIFKVLFNATCEMQNEAFTQLLDESVHLSTFLHGLVFMHAPFNDPDLLSHLLHIFINLPAEAAKCFSPPLPDCTANNESEFQGRDMKAVRIILSVLEQHHKDHSRAMSILIAFCQLCRHNANIRKYLRAEVLPPLKVSLVRPQDGEDLRAKVVNLMLTTDTRLNTMAADFLFVLCKENTQRFLRYVGFGNAAGFMASRGLMGENVANVDGNYSEDELSDVEDEDLDIFTGAKEEEKPKNTALDDMTEEEKEEEAQKLIDVLKRLQEMEVCTPLNVGRDGNITELILPDEDIR